MFFSVKKKLYFFNFVIFSIDSVKEINNFIYNKYNNIIAN